MESLNRNTCMLGSNEDFYFNCMTMMKSKITKHTHVYIYIYLYIGQFKKMAPTAIAV